MKIEDLDLIATGGPISHEHALHIIFRDAADNFPAIDYIRMVSQYMKLRPEMTDEESSAALEAIESHHNRMKEKVKRLTNIVDEDLLPERDPRHKFTRRIILKWLRRLGYYDPKVLNQKEAWKRLKASCKLPGKIQLEFTPINMKARVFQPRGILGNKLMAYGLIEEDGVLHSAQMLLARTPVGYVCSRILIVQPIKL
jgi:hypothetical protein